MSLTKVYIVDDPLATPVKVEPFEVSNVADFLVQHFKKWPKNAKIYNGEVKLGYDVTPYDETTLLALNKLEGPLYVVLYPRGVTVAIIIASIALAIAAAVLFRPKIPKVATREADRSSPNNQLGERSNKGRPGGRIPDIFGQVRCTPDLLGEPYRVFEENVEIEYGFYCIGRGRHEVTDIREDTTLISQIPGSTVEVYNPDGTHKPPMMSGGSLQAGSYSYRAGTGTLPALLNAKRHKSVSGQVLIPPNVAFPAGKSVSFTYDSTNGHVLLDSSTYESFLDYFTANSQIVLGTDLQWTYDPEVPIVVSLAGTYDIISVSTYEMVIHKSDMSQWAIFSPGPSPTFTTVSTSLANTGYKVLGPYIIDAPVDQIVANFVAENGLYKDNGTTRVALGVSGVLEVTPVDASGTPTGSAQQYGLFLKGSTSGSATLRAQTAFFAPTAGLSRYSVRAWRTTNTDTGGGSQVYDTIKWRDLYGATYVTGTQYTAMGDVTTVYAATRATKDALLQGSRKLNMRVTRMVHLWNSGTGQFYTAWDPASNAWLCLAYMCLDPYIGRRQLADIDVQSFVDAEAAVISYFGTLAAGYRSGSNLGYAYIGFGYTFDKENMSFEEMAATVASAMFCQLYRQGNVIRMRFERPQTDSVLLFNHRNKIPGSEVRNVNFGYLDDCDGVELQYADPDNYDELKTIYAPTAGSPSPNAKRIETLGVRNHYQAYSLLWRIWNKIKYQKMTVEFEGTQETNILLVGDKILNADNTRPTTQDGEILFQSNTELILSQPVTLVGGHSYTIFVQHIDGTIESKGITAGAAPNRVTLASNLRATVSTDPNHYARATYTIVRDDDVETRAFLISEMSANSNFTSKVKAVNYDSRYYQDDGKNY